MVQLTLAMVRLVHQLQVLMVVDFHKSHLHGAIGLRQREGLFVPEKVLIKCPRLRQVADENGVVGYAENLGPRRLRSCRTQVEAAEQGRTCNQYSNELHTPESIAIGRAG